MKQFGLVDIGSNTIRLVIFHYHSDTGLKELRNIKAPARLAQYIDDDMTMSQDGIEHLISILTSFDNVATDAGVSEMYPIATAAIRGSNNLEDIVRQVKERVGMEIVVISGDEEAYYGYNAVAHTISNVDAVTVDIGGASCEITYYENKELLESVSLPFGVVTLQDMFFKDKAHNNQEAIEACSLYITEQLSNVRWIAKLGVSVIAIGGSARNIARIHQSMTNYPIAGVHGYTLDDKDIDQVATLLIDTDEDDLDNIDGLSKERSDIILPSVLVFKALYDVVNAEEFKFSRNGLREGYAINRIKEKYPTSFKRFNIFDDALHQIGNDFHIKGVEGQKRRNLASKVYQELYLNGLLNVNKHEKRLMKSAAYLFDLGEFIDKDASSQHTYYILSNSNLNGLPHKDRVRLALLASYKNKSLLKFFAKETEWFTDEEIETMDALGSVLKFSNALDISNTGIVEDLRMNFDTDSDTAELVVYHVGDPIAESYQSNRQKKHIERIIDKDLVITFLDVAK